MDAAINVILWIGIQLVIVDAQVASKVQAMIPPHVLLSKICIR